MSAKVNNNVAIENELSRVDIRQKVTGAARYTADQYLPKMVYARFIRFPMGAGTIRSSKVEAARAVPGVIEVELNEKTEGRYAGHRLGHIVAESRDALEDALDALALRFEPKSHISDASAAYAGVPDLAPAAEESLAAVLEKASAVVEARYETQVQTHSCLEPHGLVVDFRGESAKVWASTQGTFSVLDGLTRPLGLAASEIEVNCEYVGGGFGSKFGPGPEGELAASVSKRLGRPCKVMLDRSEEHNDAGNRPGSIQFMRVGVAQDGKLLGGRIHCASIVGHSPGQGGCNNPILYDFGKVERTETEIQLNAGLPRAFRAPGHPQGVFAVESMMDELAAKLGMDPVEFRKKNETSDRRQRQWDRGAEIFEWTRRRASAGGSGRFRRGVGCGGSTWYTWGTECQADCTVHRDGRVEVRSGVQDIGTGTFTVVTDVAAEAMQLSRKWVTGKVGRSSYPEGPASGGSVVSRSVAPAVVDACRSAMEQLTQAVATNWKVPVAEVKYSGGVFSKADGSATLDWPGACSKLSSAKITATGRLKESELGAGSSDGVQFAEVEVDTLTGIVRVKHVVAVQACGRIVNRLTTENQICGGVIQGVSYALFEDRRLDRPTGGVVNADFLNYKIAGSVDIPEIIPVLDADERDTGVRSLGEPATIPTAGAVANAVANAIGARVRSLPITPEKVLAALATIGEKA